MKLELEINELNFILQMLGKMPMDQVEPLVNKIRMQIKEQQPEE